MNTHRHEGDKCDQPHSITECGIFITNAKSTNKILIFVDMYKKSFVMKKKGVVLSQIEEGEEHDSGVVVPQKI